MLLEAPHEGLRVRISYLWLRGFWGLRSVLVAGQVIFRLLWVATNSSGAKLCTTSKLPNHVGLGFRVEGLGFRA